MKNSYLPAIIYTLRGISDIQEFLFLYREYLREEELFKIRELQIDKEVWK